MYSGVIEERTERSTIEYAIISKAIEQLSSWGTLSAANLEKLKEIQHIILYEEGYTFSVDETLSRILQFYCRFVPCQTD